MMKANSNMESALQQALAAVQKLVNFNKVVSPLPEGYSPTPAPTRQPLPSPTPTLHPNTPTDLHKVIYDSAQKYGIPAGQLSNLFFKESSYNPKVMYGQQNSSMGAQGIGQFMPQTVEEVSKTYGKFDPLNPKEAIPASSAYLQALHKRFKDWPQTYAAYNAGPGRVMGAMNNAPNFDDALKQLPTETQDYVKFILNGK